LHPGLVRSTVLCVVDDVVLYLVCIVGVGFGVFVIRDVVMVSKWC
jgi:hypothetical protein